MNNILQNVHDICGTSSCLVSAMLPIQHIHTPTNNKRYGHVLNMACTEDELQTYRAVKPTKAQARIHICHLPKTLQIARCYITHPTPTPNEQNHTEKFKQLKAKSSNTNTPHCISPPPARELTRQTIHSYHEQHRKVTQAPCKWKVAPWMRAMWAQGRNRQADRGATIPKITTLLARALLALLR